MIVRRPKKRVSNAPPFFAKLQELSEILRKSHVQNFYKGKPILLYYRKNGYEFFRKSQILSKILRKK